MKPPRLVMVTRRFWPLSGGTEKTLARLAAALAARGCPTTILTARTQAAWPAAIRFGDVPVVRLSPPPEGRWNTWRYAARWPAGSAATGRLRSGLRLDAARGSGRGDGGGRQRPVVLRPGRIGRYGDCFWQIEAAGGRRIKRAVLRRRPLSPPLRQRAGDRSRRLRPARASTTCRWESTSCRRTVRPIALPPADCWPTPTRHCSLPLDPAGGLDQGGRGLAAAGRNCWRRGRWWPSGGWPPSCGWPAEAAGPRSSGESPPASGPAAWPPSACSTRRGATGGRRRAGGPIAGGRPGGVVGSDGRRAARGGRRRARQPSSWQPRAERPVGAAGHVAALAAAIVRLLEQPSWPPGWASPPHRAAEFSMARMTEAHWHCRPASRHAAGDIGLRPNFGHSMTSCRPIAWSGCSKSGGEPLKKPEKNSAQPGPAPDWLPAFLMLLAFRLSC